MLYLGGLPAACGRGWEKTLLLKLAFVSRACLFGSFTRCLFPLKKEVLGLISAVLCIYVCMYANAMSLQHYPLQMPIPPKLLQ